MTEEINDDEIQYVTSKTIQILLNFFEHNQTEKSIS
jgi:hypothetical protein